MTRVAHPARSTRSGDAVGIFHPLTLLASLALWTMIGALAMRACDLEAADFNPRGDHMADAHDAVVDQAVHKFQVELETALRSPHERLRNEIWDLIAKKWEQAPEYPHGFRAVTPIATPSTCARCGMIRDHPVHRENRLR